MAAMLSQRALRSPAEHALLFLADGTLEHASIDAASTLHGSDSVCLSELVRAAAAAKQEEPAGIHTLHGHGCCTGVVRMDGPLGVRYLVTVRVTEVGVGGVAVADLSPRQHAIARLAADGVTAREMARALGISAHTVRQHLKVAYRALGVSSRVELARTMVSMWNL